MTRKIKKKKRFLSLVLALTMVLGVIPTSGATSKAAANDDVIAWKDNNNNGKIDSGEATYTNLTTALKSGGTVKLVAGDEIISAVDSLTEGYINLSDTTVTLDLNGRTLQFDSHSTEKGIFLSGTAKLTITDTAGGGRVLAGYVNNPYSISDSAQFIIAGGCFNKALKNEHIKGNASVVITGGNFEWGFDPSPWIANNCRVKAAELTGYYWTVVPITEEEIVAWNDKDNDGVIDDDERIFATMQDMLNVGGNLRLYRDITSSEERFEVYNNTILDLNGHGITATASANGNSLFYIWDNVSLTLCDSAGSGYVDSKTRKIVGCQNSTSSLTIEGGDYYAADSYPFSSYSTNPVRLTGGRYNFDTNENYKIEGYTSVKEADLWVIYPTPEDCTIQVEGTYYYTGNAVVPTNVIVKEKDGTILKENVDYTLSYKNNVEAGRAQVVADFIGKYRSTKTEEFIIHSFAVSDSTEGSVQIPQYGSTANVTLSALVDDTEDVASDTTWELVGSYTSVSLNGNVITVGSTAQKGIVKVRGTYQGAQDVLSFQLVQTALPEVSISDSVTYNGSPQKPTVTVQDLTEGKDYKVTYFRGDEETTDFTNAGTIRVVITGIGAYDGVVNKSYTIKRKTIAEGDVNISEDATYNGTQQKPTISAPGLTPDKDYSISYTRDEESTVDFTNVGSITVIVTGEGNYIGTVSKSYTILQKEIAESDVVLSETEHSWDGVAHSPVVTVYGVDAATLKEGLEYVVRYTRNKKDTVDFTTCGTVTITVTAEGNYKGSIEKQFKIEHVYDDDEICKGCGFGYYYVKYTWNESDATLSSELVNMTKEELTMVTEDGPSEWTDGWYAVADSVALSTVTVTGDVHLILMDGATLSASNILVSGGNSLTVYGQKKETGVLNVEGRGTAIGGAAGESAGTVIIHGGNISAKAEGSGAGIGSGQKGSGGTITIYHGKVTAVGSDSGIGDGNAATGTKITIYGGDVTASGGYMSPGIGGNNGFSVAIHGGNVIAGGGDYAAGIGGSYNYPTGTIVITGGNIKATAGRKSNSGSFKIPEAVGCGVLWNGTNNVTVTDGKGNAVSLKTLTLDGLTEVASITAVTGSTYGLNDVNTLDTNKLYFYTPDNTVFTSISTESDTYICNQNNTYYKEHLYVSDCADTCSRCGLHRKTTVPHEYDEENGLCDNCGAGKPAEKNAEGDYKIYNAGNLCWFAGLVNGTLADTVQNQLANAILMNDIDMEKATTYVPIGGTTGLYYTAEGEDRGYQGMFDGDGHVIKNLSVVGSSTAELTYGVFGTLSGTVKHLGVENFTFTLGSKDCRAGGIVGQMLSGGSLTNCYVANSNITATNKVAGGMVGCNYAGRIQNCYTYKVSVTATRTGGIVGDNCGDNSGDRKGTVINCYTDADAIENSQRAGTVSESTASVSEETFASGEIAYKLNGSTSVDTSESPLVWYQTLLGDDKQDHPQFTGKIVRYSSDQYRNEKPVNIIGVSAVSGTYNGSSHKGYTGSPENEDGYTGTYDVVYTGRNDTEYDSEKAPTNAGDYTVTISTDSAETEYAGSLSLDFTIAKKEVTVTVGEQKIAEGNELSKDSVFVGKVLAGHVATVTAVQKGTDCNYTAIIVIKDADDNDVTANYTFSSTGIYHEYAWDTTDHTYKCITCGDVDKTDNDMPTAEYKIGTNGFKKFINKISFGLFCKDYQNVSITAADKTSGVKSVEYHISEKEITSDELEMVTWSEYENELSLSVKGTYFIYVRVLDKAGNTAIYNSEGIVIFADSTAKVEVEYTRTSGQSVKAEIDFNGNTVQRLTYKNTVLTSGTDYTVNENGITFTSTFLETLTASETAHQVHVSYNAGGVEWNEETSYGTEPTDTVIAIRVKRTTGSVTKLGDVSKIYDGSSVSNPTYTSDSTGKATYEYKISGAKDSTYSTAAPKNVGNYVVRVTVAADENYNKASATKEFTITKAEITVTAKEDKKIYGEKDPTLTYTITSGTIFGNDKLENISVKRENGENVNSYTITVSQMQGANPNYEITFVDGIFTISKKTISIGWGDCSFTYDGTEKLPTATIRNAAFDDEIKLIVEGGEILVGTGYIATVTGITGDQADNYQLPSEVTKTFAIARAEQIPPRELAHTDETIDAKSDGTISGLKSTMEYRKDEEKGYTAITDSKLENCSDGTYYIRYKADDNHNASPDTAIVIAKGRKLTVIDRGNQAGYILSLNKTELAWNEDVTLTLAIKEGYSKQSNFAVKVNGEQVTLDGNGTYTVSNVKQDVIVRVEGIEDNTAPTAEIIFGTNKWNQFLNNITFGLFFKNTQTVTITVEDKGSGVDKIYYYLTTSELTESEIKALHHDRWTEYTDAFNINMEDECIIYAKAVDKENNIVYINSNGFVLDGIAPTISGVENGETYYGDTTFAATDKHLEEVKVDGKAVTLSEGKYTITADGKEHTILAIDKAGNSTAEIKVKVVTIKSLDDIIEDITVDNVKSSDKETIDDVQSIIKDLISSGKDFTETEQDQLDAIEKNIESLLEKISDVSDEILELESGVKDYDLEIVKPEDKQTLNELIARIDMLLNGNNLTDDERESMVILKMTAQDFVKNIDDATKKDEESDISETEDTDKGEEVASDNAENKDKVILSPVTGDSSNIWIWLALLFVSGGGLLGIVVHRRKETEI